ncbi:hypothetical protein [Paenibacillus sp. FSL H3-0333]|uniref:hypothetical protein n=1 Tax=Paenibacillus sp. FSL H3-0333 TaxID=2921373 RepID=UPI0030F80720
MNEIAMHIQKAYEHILQADKLLDGIEEDNRANSALKMFFKEHVISHEAYVEWTKEYLESKRNLILTSEEGL